MAKSPLRYRTVIAVETPLSIDERITPASPRHEEPSPCGKTYKRSVTKTSSAQILTSQRLENSPRSIGIFLAKYLDALFFTRPASPSQRMEVDMRHQVICADNFFTGSKDNIISLLDNPYFEMLRHDVCFPLYVEVDEIYNLACPASPVYYQRDPVQTVKTSVHGAINILGLAKRLRAKVFQASTSEVYGDPLMHPQKESYWGHVNPIGMRSCYDEGKHCAETLFFNYHQQHGVEIKVARIFNTYGPYMQRDDGRVVSNFIVQALKNQPITLYGDGSQTRSFSYVSDLIEGIVRLMDTAPEVMGPMNFGNFFVFLVFFFVL